MDTSKQQMGVQVFKSCCNIPKVIELQGNSQKSHDIRNSEFQYNIFWEFFQERCNETYYISPVFSGSIFLLALSSSKGISDYFVFLCFEDNFFLKALVYFLSRISFSHINYKGCKLFLGKIFRQTILVILLFFIYSIVGISDISFGFPLF